MPCDDPVTSFNMKKKNDISIKDSRLNDIFSGQIMYYVKLNKHVQ